MFNLILKDFLIQKKTFLFSVFAILLFTIIDSSILMTYFVTITYIWIMTACAIDDKNKADYMLNSLPIKRETIVLARYLSVFIFSGISFIIYIFINNIVSLFNISLSFRPLTFLDFLLALTAIVFLSCLYLPFYFKFGYSKSRILNFILFFGFFSLVPIIANAISKNQKTKLTKLISSFLHTGFNLKNATLAISVLVLIFITSLIISINLYRKREF